VAQQVIWEVGWWYETHEFHLNAPHWQVGKFLCHLIDVLRPGLPRGGVSFTSRSQAPISQEAAAAMLMQMAER
jgi:hypothetical protein